MKFKNFLGPLIVLSFISVSACNDNASEQSENTAADMQVQTEKNQNIDSMNNEESEEVHLQHNKAIAVIHPTQGNDVKGTVTFTRESNAIKIVADLEGLSSGKHGFHVHEFGDCSSADGKSAGGHFNPSNEKHGAPEDQERHAGDFGNTEADASGKAHYERIDEHISLSGANSVIGRAVIIHKGTDDLKSQPSGDAGSRVACGVIGIAEEP